MSVRNSKASNFTFETQAKPYSLDTNVSNHVTTLPHFSDHVRLIHLGGASSQFRPVAHFQIENVLEDEFDQSGSLTMKFRVIEGSTNSISQDSRERYSRLEEYISDIFDEDTDTLLEHGKGALISADRVLKALCSQKISPPQLSWDGDEAVVMIWSLADTTYGITITDGELGYVVRRDRRTIKKGHSLSIGAVRLEDLIT